MPSGKKLQEKCSSLTMTHFFLTFTHLLSNNIDRKRIVETGVSIELKFKIYLYPKIETYLEHGRNIPRARLKHTSSTVETNLAHGRNIPRAQLEHTSSTVKQGQKYRLFCGNSESRRKFKKKKKKKKKKKTRTLFLNNSDSNS